MRITESKLRRIIRSVILESIESGHSPVYTEKEIARFISFIVRFCEENDKDESPTHTKEDYEESRKELKGAVEGSVEMLGPYKDIPTKNEPLSLLSHLKGKDLSNILNVIRRSSGTGMIEGFYTIKKEMLKVLGFDDNKIKSLTEDAMYYKEMGQYITSFEDKGEELTFRFNWSRFFNN